MRIIRHSIMFILIVINIFIARKEREFSSSIEWFMFVLPPKKQSHHKLLNNRRLPPAWIIEKLINNSWWRDFLGENVFVFNFSFLRALTQILWKFNLLNNFFFWLNPNWSSISTFVRELRGEKMLRKKIIFVWN